MTRNRVYLATLVSLLVAVFMVLLFLSLLQDAEIQVHANAAPQRQNLDQIQPTTSTLPANFGELVEALNRPSPTVPIKATRAVDLGTVWDRLAQCESGGDWSIDAFHDGGLQFAVQTWASYAPADFPPYAYQATREQQIVVAERVLRDQGWGAWPTCSKRLGLR